VGKVSVGGGSILGGLEIFDALSERTGTISEMTGKLQPALDLVQANIPVILIAGGAFIVYQMIQAQKKRVQDHREGKNVGR